MQEGDYNLLINLLLVLVAVLTATEVIFDKRRRILGLWKVRGRGWLLLGCLSLGVVFNYVRDCAANVRQLESDVKRRTLDSLLTDSQKQILALQVSSKDTILHKVEETYNNSIRASNDALAKYNLKITDSLHAVVSTLKLGSSSPQLLLRPNGPGVQSPFMSTVDQRSLLNIQFISKGGTCYRIQLVAYVIDTSFTRVLMREQLTQAETFLTEDVLKTRTMDIGPELLSLSRAIVYITGTFCKDPEGNQALPFNAAFDYAFAQKRLIGNREFDDIQELKARVGIE